MNDFNTPSLQADCPATEVFRIGKVTSVKGRAVEVEVDKTKNSSHLIYRGELLKNVSVGGYVKIVKGFTKIVGKVEGEYIFEDKLTLDKAQYVSSRAKVRRILSVTLLGYFEGLAFERGVKELPLIDNGCFLLEGKEFERVHDFIKDDDDPITIGSLALEKGQEVRVGVSGLFASHIGIFGNTGSGKSYTLAKIYRQLFVKYARNRRFRRRARFFLIDFNGEYIGRGRSNSVIVNKKYKNTYRLSTRTQEGGDKIPIPAETLNDPDFWVVFLEATEKTQTPFLRRAVDKEYVASKLQDETEFKSLFSTLIFEAIRAGSDRNIEKTIVNNLVKEICDALGGNQSAASLLRDYERNLQFHSTANKFYYQAPNQPRRFYDDDGFERDFVRQKVDVLEIAVGDLTHIDKIRLQIVIQYYEDIIRGFSNKEHLAPLIKRLDKRIDGLKKTVAVGEDETTRNLTIVSLKDVNIQLKKILPLLLCKRLYNEKKDENDDTKYLNIIIDEAHNILSENSERESEQWKDYRLEAFEEMIKEGRKFGVFLTIASQRPADISPTIISQLHNYFLHRLINNEDINAIRQTVSYLDRVSFESLSILPTGTCILAGLLANVPIVVDIGRIEPSKHEPFNKTIKLAELWRSSADFGTR